VQGEKWGNPLKRAGSSFATLGRYRLPWLVGERREGSDRVFNKKRELDQYRKKRQTLSVEGRKGRGKLRGLDRGRGIDIRIGKKEIGRASFEFLEHRNSSNLVYRGKGRRASLTRSGCAQAYLRKKRRSRARGFEK